MMTLYLIGFVTVIPVMLWIIYTDNHRITVGNLVAAVVLGFIPVLNIMMALGGIVIMFVYYVVVLVQWIERSEIMNKRIL